MWLRLCAAALPIAASAMVAPAADAKSSNSIAIGMAGAVESDGDLFRQHLDGRHGGDTQSRRTKLRKSSHRSKIRATLAHHKHRVSRQHVRVHAWRSSGKLHAHLHQRHRDIQAHLHAHLHVPSVRMRDLNVRHKEHVAATKSTTDKLGHLVLSLHDHARIPMPQPRPVLSRRRDDDGQSLRAGAGWTDQSKQIGPEYQPADCGHRCPFGRGHELKMVDSNPSPEDALRPVEQQHLQPTAIEAAEAEPASSAVSPVGEGKQRQSAALMVPDQDRRQTASVPTDEQTRSGSSAAVEANASSRLSTVVALPPEDRAPAAQRDQVAPSVIAAIRSDEEIDLATVAPTPEPITGADRENIFRRYERGLLQPIGNCFDYEQIDPRIKRVVSDAAVHFAGVALLSSCYRSPSYNRRVHGAHRSMHMQHKALDFVIRHDGHLIDKFVLAKWVRNHPMMRDIGGVGTYCGQDAIHADTGARRNWYWGCTRSSQVRSAHVVHRHHHVAMQ